MATDGMILEYPGGRLSWLTLCCTSTAVDVALWAVARFGHGGINAGATPCSRWPATSPPSRARSRFSTWLYEVTANCARGTYRTLKRRSVEQLSSDAFPDRAVAARTSVIAGSRVDLLDALERLEDHRRDLAEAVVLRDVAGLEYTEIAHRLRIPLGTVKSRIHDGRTLLRGWLTTHD